MPKRTITGPDMLRAVKEATKSLPQGLPFSISLLDSYDLCKLDVDQLVGEFGFERDVAERVVSALNRHDLSVLSLAIGIQLTIDRDLRTSLIPNAGIIRSAGAWEDNSGVPTNPDDIVEAIRRMRFPNPSR